MKVILIFLALAQMNISWSQNGFKVIRKAEKQIDKGNYSKAIKLLDKAGSMNYGFCGNAWEEAEIAIAKSRVEIYDAKGEFSKAANELNALDYFYSENLDSLKMVYYLKSIDKRFIKQQIDSCIEAIDDINSIDFLTEFAFQVTFSEKPFKISYSTLKKLRRETYVLSKENEMFTNLERFKMSLRNQPFYLLLVE